MTTRSTTVIAVRWRLLLGFRPDGDSYCAGWRGFGDAIFPLSDAFEVLKWAGAAYLIWLGIQHGAPLVQLTLNR